MSSKRKPKASGSPSSSERVLVDTSVLVEYSRTKKLELLGNSYLCTIFLLVYCKLYNTLKEKVNLLKTQIF